MINIPGTAVVAATALDGYPLACQWKAGKALGLTTAASAIGTLIGMLLVKQVTKLLRISPPVFMPIIAVLCVIGSYSLGLRIFNLYLMVPVGILAYFLTEMEYPIAPLVIGVILGPMADANLRRALMVSKGSFLPIITRPVSLILVLIIILTVASQTKWYKNLIKKITEKLFVKKEK